MSTETRKEIQADMRAALQRLERYDRTDDRYARGVLERARAHVRSTIEAAAADVCCARGLAARADAALAAVDAAVETAIMSKAVTR